MHGPYPLALATALALATVSGCGCEPGFSEPREVNFEPQAPLRAAAGGDVRPFYLVDAAGRVTILGDVRVRRHHELGVVDTIELSARPLVDIAVVGSGDDTKVWVVDEAGTVHESVDAGRTWTSHPLDAELEPRGLVLVGSVVIIYGEGFVRALDGDAWFEPPVPYAGWGSLRISTTWRKPLVLSDGESLLVADGDPQQFSWHRLAAPTEVLTLGGGAYGDILIGGRQGRVLGTNAERLGPDSKWDEIQLPINGDLVAFGFGSALTSAGELVHLETREVVDVGDASAGMAWASGFLTFGADGPLMTTDYHVCNGF